MMSVYYFQSHIKIIMNNKKNMHLKSIGWQKDRADLGDGLF